MRSKVKKYRSIGETSEWFHLQGNDSSLSVFYTLIAQTLKLWMDSKT